MNSYEMEPTQYTFVKREILKLTDVDLNAYKTPQVQRRLKTFLVRSDHATWSTFFRDARSDEQALWKLRDYLTINVSSFFRDVPKYEYLEKKILPELLRGRSKLRVWSAGCSWGQEPYTLAMLLHKLAPASCWYRILATDIDDSALDLARARGPYSADDVANVPSRLLRRHFVQDDDGYRINKDMQRRITFRHLNPLSDSFESAFDLIVCRNVVIYFTTPVKDRLYRRFYDALRPAGVLFVGGTEIISNAAAIGFKTTGMSFYRRNGAG